MSVRFKKAIIPETFISFCGRFTIKPASMTTGWSGAGGYVLGDIKTGKTYLSTTEKGCKRDANNIVTYGDALK